MNKKTQETEELILPLEQLQEQIAVLHALTISEIEDSIITNNKNKKSKLTKKLEKLHEIEDQIKEITKIKKNITKSLKNLPNWP